MTRLPCWPDCLFGHVDITPENGVPLAGYVDRRGPSAGVQSRLEANLLLCEADGEPLVLIGLDTLFGSDVLRERLAAALAPRIADLCPRHVQLVASHTHYAPNLDPTKPRLGAFDEGYFAEVVERLSGCIVALLDEGAVTIDRCRRTTSRCAENIYRRRWTWVRERRSMRFRWQVAAAPDRRVAIDSTARVSTLLDTAGDVRLVFWSWPCHAVSRGQTNRVSADFPGVVRERLRARYGAGTVVVFLPGLCGDVRPRLTRSIPSLRELIAMPLARGFAPFDEAGHVRWCERVAAAVVPDGAHGTDETKATAGAQVRTHSLPLTDLRFGLDGDDRRLDCTRIVLPPVSLALINAEVCTGYADALEDVDHASGCGNAVHGYLPTDEQIAEGGYEVDGFAPLFALPGGYRPFISRTVKALFRRGALE